MGGKDKPNKSLLFSKDYQHDQKLFLIFHLSMSVPNINKKFGNVF